MQSGPVSSRRSMPTFTEIARRAQIVQSTIETVAEFGYAGTSLVRIAEHAGTSKGVVTYHFASKEQLIDAVYDEAMARAREFIGPRVAQAATGREVLRAYIESNFAFMRQSWELMIALVEIAVGARADDGSPIYGERRLDAIVAPLAQLLTEFQAAGEFREFDADTMASAIRATIDAVPPRLAREPDLDLESYGKEIATAFVLATQRHD